VLSHILLQREKSAIQTLQQAPGCRCADGACADPGAAHAFDNAALDAIEVMAHSINLFIEV